MMNVFQLVQNRCAQFGFAHGLHLLTTVALCAGLSFGCGRDSILSRAQTLPPSVKLTVAPLRTVSGGSATLTWTSADATECVASGGWSGGKPTSGSQTTGPLNDTDTTRFTLSCSGPHGTTRATTRINVGTTTASVAFPLRVVRGTRHLLDAQGQPFLIHGDSAWSLIVQLTREEVHRYLDDRRARGFNTLLVNLIEHQFANRAPKNVYGDEPFLTPGDFQTPNPAYFAHADWVLERAADKGFLVLLVPSYLGFEGGPHGWYEKMVAAGSTALQEYGRFLGQRYKDFTNIMWTHGGDYNPPDRTVIQAIADGIREFDTRALGTAHCAPETAAIEYWGGEPWLQVNTVYTYNPVHPVALRQYQRSETIPFFLIESVYENDRNVTVQQLRTQAYHALLSGAAGQVFGNHPIWHFGGPRLPRVPVTWKQALDGPGSRSMTHVWNLFAPDPWWMLVPDTKNTMLLGVLGWGHNRAVAALSEDQSFGIAYIPISREVTIDLGRLAGPNVMATWYDPTSGSYRAIHASPFPANGVRTLRSNGKNAAGDFDWVLLLDSRP